MQYQKYTNPENQQEQITIPENIHAKITKPEHQTTTTPPKTLDDLVNFGEITLNEILQEYTYTIMPYLATNEHMNEILTEPFTLHIKNKTRNQEYQITQNNTEPLTITITGTPNDTIQKWTNHPELADYLIIQHPNQKINENNIAQNRPTYLFHPETNPQRDTLTTQLGHLTNPEWQNQLELYTFQYNLQSSTGNPHTFNNDLLLMLVGRGPIGGLIKKRTINPNHEEDGHAIEFFNFKNHPQTGTPTPDNVFQNQLAVQNNILQHTHTPTGRNLLPAISYTIYNMEQPEIIAAQQRGWTYTSSTWIYGSNPGNSITLDFETLTITTSYARYPLSTTTAVMQEEKIEDLLGTIDPTNGGTASRITTYDENGIATLNQFGKTMFKAWLLSNVGTRALPANTQTKNVDAFKIKYTEKNNTQK